MCFSSFLFFKGLYTKTYTRTEHIYRKWEAVVMRVCLNAILHICSCVFWATVRPIARAPDAKRLSNDTRRLPTMVTFWCHWQPYAEVPGENPRIHRENMQTPHRKAPAWKPLAVRQLS